MPTSIPAYLFGLPITRMSRKRCLDKLYIVQRYRSFGHTIRSQIHRIKLNKEYVVLPVTANQVR